MSDVPSILTGLLNILVEIKDSVFRRKYCVFFVCVPTKEITENKANTAGLCKCISKEEGSFGSA